MAKQSLNVEILLEHTRGSRGDHNSRTMLLPLVQNFRNTVKVSLYHSPSLRGLLKLLLPERFNETVALTHLKVYLTDNTLIMSGYVLIQVKSLKLCIVSDDEKNPSYASHLNNQNNNNYYSYFGQH